MQPTASPRSAFQRLMHTLAGSGDGGDMSKEKIASQEQRAGHWLKCPICGGDKFWRRQAQLSTRFMTLLELDWASPRGDCYICENCRHIQWFYGENEKL